VEFHSSSRPTRNQFRINRPSKLRCVAIKSQSKWSNFPTVPAESNPSTSRSTTISSCSPTATGNRFTRNPKLTSPCSTWPHWSPWQVVGGWPKSFAIITYQSNGRFWLAENQFDGELLLTHGKLPMDVREYDYISRRLLQLLEYNYIDSRQRQLVLDNAVRRPATSSRGRTSSLPTTSSTYLG
jgi:hypothetical protein